MQSFYNTCSLSGQQLRDAVKNATKQEEAILIVFKNTRKPWTPSDIFKACEKAGHKFLLTSIRRAMSNLTSTKDLVKTRDMKQGINGSPEHFWQLNFQKHPTPTGVEQANLF